MKKKKNFFCVNNWDYIVFYCCFVVFFFNYRYIERHKTCKRSKMSSLIDVFAQSRAAESAPNRHKASACTCNYIRIVVRPFEMLESANAYRDFNHIILFVIVPHVIGPYQISFRLLDYS